jgi:hypothetical protein
VKTQATGGGLDCEAKYELPELSQTAGSASCTQAAEYLGTGDYGFASSSQSSYMLVTSGTCASNGFSKPSSEKECMKWAKHIGGGYGFYAKPAFGGKTPTGSGYKGLSVVNLDAPAQASISPLGCFLVDSQDGTTNIGGSNPF